MTIRLKLNSTTATIKFSRTLVFNWLLSALPAIFLLSIGLVSIFDPANINKAVLVGVCAWLSIFIFVGIKYKNSLVDPKSFILVLIFATISILLYLLASSSSLNTLGTYPVNYLGGIHILCLVALYYLTYWISNRINLQLVNSTAIFVALVAVVPMANLSGSNFISLGIVAVGLVFAIYNFINASKIFTYLVNFLLILIFFVAITIVSANTPYAVAWLVLQVGVAIQILLGLKLKQINNNLKAEWKELKAFVSSYMQQAQVKTAFKFKYLASAILLLSGVLGILITLIANKGSLLKSANSIFLDYSQAFKNLTGLEFLQVLVGKGASKISTGINSINFDSLIPVVLKFSGLIGILLLVVFGSFVLWQAIKSKNNLTAFLKFSFVYLPVIGFVFIPGYYIVALWWIGYGLLDSQDYLPKPWVLRVYKVKRVPTWLVNLALNLIPILVFVLITFIIFKIP